AADDIHEMLADIPSEMRCRCDHPRKLAGLLLEAELADAVRIEADGMLAATTQTALRLYQYLTSSAAAGEVQVTEMRSADESLQEVFNSLMKMHRGEL